MSNRNKKQTVKKRFPISQSFSFSNNDYKIKNRSKVKMNKGDLQRLGKIARKDFKNFCKRNPKYKVLDIKAICLCQGGAVHYLDGKNGIHDFDVFLIFDKAQTPRYPHRTIHKLDYGTNKFGKAQKPEYSHFVGRKVDILGSSISFKQDQTPQDAIRGWLKGKKSIRPKCLAEKAIIGIEPVLGEVIYRSENI